MHPGLRHNAKRSIILAVALTVVIVGTVLTARAAQGYANFVGSYHDDAIYIVCAKSLATGLGYRILSLPMEPFQTKYPPLFPLSLATAFVFDGDFPHNIPWLEAIACLYGVAFALAAAAWLVISGRATPLLGLTVLAATWLNLNFLSYMPVPMAEMECAALAVFGLWLCEEAQKKERQSPGSRRGEILKRWLPSTIVLSASALTHTMGIFALGAASIYLVARRSFRALAVTCAVSAAMLLPSWIWAGYHSYTAPPTMVYYTNYLLAARATAQQGALPVFVAKNLSTGFTEVMDTAVQALKSLPDSASARPLDAIIYGALWIVLFLGVGRELISRCGSNLLAIWISVHGLAHLLWPRGVGMRRLLIALPFIYYFLFSGWRLIGKSMKPALRALLPLSGKVVAPRRYGTLCGALAVLFAALLIVGNLEQSRRWVGQYAYRVPPPAKAGPHYTESSEFAEAYRWIEENTAPDTVLVWNNDPAAYLWTGRKAIAASIGESFGVSVYPDAAITADDLIESIRLAGGDYLVIDPISVGGLAGFDQIGLAVQSLIKERPGSLTHVFTSRYGLVTIFKIDRTRLQK